MDNDLVAEMERGLDKHPEDMARLKSGDPSALADLLEACTGAKVATARLRNLAS